MSWQGDIALDVLAIFAEEGDHARCFDDRDGVRRSWSTPIVRKAAEMSANAARSLARYHADPFVRAANFATKRRERERVRCEREQAQREQDERVRAAAKRVPIDGLARERALCADCRKRMPGAGWCPLHERVTTMRQRLERERAGRTHHFVVIAREDPNDDQNAELREFDGYLTVNVDDKNRLLEIFVRIGKLGEWSQLLDQWAMAVSMALQNGVSVRRIFSKFAHQQFWPNGGTRSAEIPRCSSFTDYISRWILLKYEGTVANWDDPEPTLTMLAGVPEEVKP